jgi:hypothetical protein
MHSEATNPYESDKIQFPELIAMPCVLAHTCSKIMTLQASTLPWWVCDQATTMSKSYCKKEENFGSNFLSIDLL